MLSSGSTGLETIIQIFKGAKTLVVDISFNFIALLTTETGEQSVRWKDRHIDKWTDLMTLFEFIESVTTPNMILENIWVSI